ncbi:MAG: hypothetical protein AAB874_01795 [Patescibacteria group bacterium]
MSPEQSFAKKVAEAKVFQHYGNLANQIDSFFPDLDPRILLAFEDVDRFVFAGWFLELGQSQRWTMEDMLMLVNFMGASLPISAEATTSHPVLIAQMHAHALPADATDLSKKTIVEIGSGCGYGLALLSAEGWGNVFGFEIDQGLTEYSTQAVGQCGYSPTIVKGNGFKMLPTLAKKQPIDSVIVSAAFPRGLGARYISHLRSGGKLVIPEMVDRPRDGIAQTQIQVYTRRDEGYEHYELGQVTQFVVGRT